MFITFEGIEGCGKTTQIELLFTYLKNKGHKVIRTREPGGTPFGEELREAFLRTESKVSSMCELLVFTAMRAQHVEEVIEPALRKGTIVLCDRFSDATYAYQGYGRGLDLDTIDSLNLLATRGLAPDITIFMDLPAREGLLRKARSAKMDRFEKEKISFHNRIRQGYRKLVKKEPDRFLVVDATLDIGTIERHIRDKIRRALRSNAV